MENKLRLPFYTSADRLAAAEFIAALIPAGVTWRAAVSDGEMTITFTGGF